MSKKIYLIWSPGYDPHSGGIIALHKLANNLRNLGEECYLISDRNNPKFNTEFLLMDKAFKLKDPNAVIIYPEIISGNPFEVKNVVRWILYTPGIIGGDGIYQPTDLIFKYNEYFKVDSKYEISGILTAFDYDLDFWKDLGEKRKGTCYLVKKGSNQQLDKHPKKALKIDGWESKGNSYLLQIFNQYKYFISYDPCTFISVFASLCGCIPISIPEEGKTKEEWMNSIPIYKYGVAYGFDDIERAKSTREDLIDLLKKQESISIEETKRFIKICEEKF